MGNTYLLVDHKTGSQLCWKLLHIINKYLDNPIKVKIFYLYHNDWNPNDKYILFTRNPKEIIISGYLYHKGQCKEKWACNRKGDYYENHIPKCISHKAAKEQSKYVEMGKHFSDKNSYKNILNSLEQSQGIIHEMKNVAYLTITGMYNLNHFGKTNVKIIKFEDLSFNFKKTITELLDYIPSKNKAKLLQEVVHLDFANTSITNHTTNKNKDKERYKKYWNPEIETEFTKLFPSDLMEKTGYSMFNT